MVIKTCPQSGGNDGGDCGGGNNDDEYAQLIVM